MGIGLRIGLVLTLCIGVSSLTGCGTQVTKSSTHGPIPDTLNKVLVSYTLTGMNAVAQSTVGDEMVKGFQECGVAAAVLDQMQRRSEVAQFDPNYELRIVWLQMQTMTSLRGGSSRDVTLSASLFNYRTKSNLWTAELEMVDNGALGSSLLGKDFSRAVLTKLKSDGILKNCH